MKDQNSMQTRLSLLILISFEMYCFQQEYIMTHNVETILIHFLYSIYMYLFEVKITLLANSMIPPDIPHLLLAL